MPARAPILYLIAGPNCAGKTTFAREFLPAAGVMEFLNADSIAAGLSPLDPPAAAVRAGPIAPGEVEDIDGGRKDFGFESTVSGLTYAKMLREAKQRGYDIRICYLYLASVKLSIRRVRQRVQRGGHDVPLADLERRYLPSLRNFFNIYLPLATDAALYDSSLQPPQLLVRWKHQKTEVIHPVPYERVTSRLS